MIAHIAQALVLMVALWITPHAIGNLVHGVALDRCDMAMGRATIDRKQAANRLKRATNGFRLAAIAWALFWFMS